MKIVARIFGVCTMLILTSMVFLETIGLTIRQDELNNCISTAVTTTQIVMKENIEDKEYGTENARQKITSNEEYLSLFKKNLDKLRTTNSKYKIKVYGVDYTRGYIDVGIDASYPMLNGEIRTLTSRQTNLIEVYDGEYQPVYGQAPDNYSYSKTFDYSGNVETWTAPKTGKYKIEAWGASSGNALRNAHIEYGTETDSEGNPLPVNMGLGGYSVGYLNVDVGTNLYVAVGGQGEDGKIPETMDGDGISKGGWNGGGNGDWDHSYDELINGSNEAWGGGGGASSVTTSLIGDGQLKNYENQKSTAVVIVAGGGGSGWSELAGNKKLSESSMNGGGYIGTDGIVYGTLSSLNGVTAKGGTQDSGYKFGEGKSSVVNFNLYANSEVGAGGGGWYGGQSYADTKAYFYIDGAGGSGYIGYTKLTGNGDATDKHMAGYHVATSDDVNTKTISVDVADSSPKADTAKIGNGCVKITYVPEGDGSPNYEPLMKLVSDNDRNNEVTAGDILEVTQYFYNDGSVTNRPQKFICLNSSNGYAEVMSLDSYESQIYGASGTDSFNDGNEYTKYDGSTLDNDLNVNYYSLLSSNTKRALKQIELTQSCFTKSNAALTDSDLSSTTFGGSTYYLSKQASVLVGQHSADKYNANATYRLVGNMKYIYLPDVEDLNDIINNGTLNKSVFDSDTAVNRIAWTRSVNTDGTLYAVDGGNSDIISSDGNSMSYEVKPTFTIDTTAVVLDNYINFGE